MSLYSVLGVEPGASSEALHAAYRARARALHPDVNRGESDDQRHAAEDAMRELNAAWAVLADPVQRAAYDRSLTPPTVPRPPVVEWRAPDDEDVGIHSPGVALLARALPLVIILAVLAGIFVFTAFAVSGDNDTPSSPPTADVGSCVRVQAGHVTAIVACGAPNDGEVIRVITRDQPCPDGEQRVDAANGSQALCTAPSR